MTRPPAEAKRLAGLRVVLTRPEGEALSLAREIQRDGGEVLHFATLVIEPLRHSQAALHVVKGLSRFDFALFLSKNAARLGVAMVQAQGGFPPGLRAIAVGPGTARTLEQLGYPDPLFPPQQHDTQGLLAMRELQADQVAGRQVAIFRGQGGLATLATQLRARGATVEYAELYRRARPVVDLHQISELKARGKVDLIVVTSSDALVNLFAMVGEDGQRWLAGCQFLVPSIRIATSVKEMGVLFRPLISAGVSDDAFLRQIRCWYGERQKEKTG